VTAEGNIIFSGPAADVVRQGCSFAPTGAEIIYDVKSSATIRALDPQTRRRASLWKTGHSLIKARMRERGAALAGEMSGHTFFVERWYGFDDASTQGRQPRRAMAPNVRSVGEVFTETGAGLLEADLERVPIERANTSSSRS